MNVLLRITGTSVQRLLRVACVLALSSIAVMVFSVLVPRPLPVIFAMSIGHALGGLGFICYVLAVALDAFKREVPGIESVAPPSVDGKNR
jgi:hypothetical protein